MSADRGQRRLIIAGRLMRPEAKDAAEALERIKAMPKAEADALREMVDWVEDYETGEPVCRSDQRT